MHYIIGYNSRKHLLNKRYDNKLVNAYEEKLYQQNKQIYEYRRCVLNEKEAKKIDHITNKVFNFDIC